MQALKHKRLDQYIHFVTLIHRKCNQWNFTLHFTMIFSWYELLEKCNDGKKGYFFVSACTQKQMYTQIQLMLLLEKVA